MIDMVSYTNRLLKNIHNANTNKIPVVYIGLQKHFVPGSSDMYLVNELSGSTVVYKPEIHTIIGSKFGVEIPKELRGDV